MPGRTNESLDASGIPPFPVRVVLRILTVVKDGMRFAIVNRSHRPQVVRSCLEYWALAVRGKFGERHRNSHDPDRPFHILGMKVHAFSAETLFFLINEIFLEREYAIQLGRPDPFILDCGSNIGVATLFFKRMYPAARIVAFEPDTKTFALLKRNVEANQLTDVSLNNLALSSETGSATFYSDLQRPGSLVMSLVKERTNGVPNAVLCDKLSRFVNAPVDLVKMDIEGAETDVIGEMRASGMLSKVSNVLMEFHHKTGPRQRLSDMLCMLEDASFGYDVQAKFPSGSGNSQDVLLRIYREAVGRPAEEQELRSYRCDSDRRGVESAADASGSYKERRASGQAVAASGIE